MRTALLLASLWLSTACGESTSAPDTTGTDDRPTVFAVNYPLRYFAERIGGDRIRQLDPLPANVDPAFWEPVFSTVSDLQGADLILLNGANYAKWAQHVSLPPSRCVDTSAAFAADFIEIEAEATHSHGPGGEHSHGGTAFTTWLDLEQARQQAAAVRDALIALLPDAREFLETSHETLDDDLRALDEAMAAAAPREPVVTSHPVYQYWARRYGVDQRSLMFEPDAVPDAAGWAELEALLSERPAKRMIWEAEPLPETRTRLESLGLEIVVVAPCGNAPAHGDFLDVMSANIAVLE